MYPNIGVSSGQFKYIENWKVCLIEEEFMNRMWEVKE